MKPMHNELSLHDVHHDQCIMLKRGHEIRSLGLLPGQRFLSSQARVESRSAMGDELQVGDKEWLTIDALE